MTETLERALAEVAKLQQDEQEALASWILEELAAERRWHRVLSDSADPLARLADEALAEHRDGMTRPLDLRRG